MIFPWKKKAVAYSTRWTGLQWLGSRWCDSLNHGCVRVVNSHSVPQASVDNYRWQLEYFSQRFSNVSHQDLVELLQSGKWTKPKPGLVLSFDDGLRTQAEVAAPLLEEFGFTGWFFLPYLFLDTPEELQRQYAEQHQIHLGEDLPGPRIAMTWEQARRLQEKHVVGCHTATHRRLRSSLTPEERQVEIADAKECLADRLGNDVDTFAWVGGEEWSYSRSAAKKIAEAGFRYSFMTNCRMLDSKSDPLKLDRTQIESDWPMSLVQFQLSGLVDLFYLRKRRSVHRETGF